ncbi:MAG: ATP-binding protein [Desulfocapsaceae bacterium]
MEANLAYEKLGLFYLGRELPIADQAQAGLPLLYKSKNLTTHGAIIGMTGSGKTGLGIGLIEEAIMDDVPSIIIDPKGDMANLLLTFPDMKPADFEPWIDPAEASRKNLTMAQMAEKTASNWRQGLASWGQGSERVENLRAKTTLTVYTPGSSAGVPVSIMASFSAPAEDVLQDQDSLNALVGSTATSLLSLVNIDGDPLTSREHILISSILLHHWRNGEDLTLETLIGAIVNPPFKKVGVFGLTSFFPQADRMKLAMLLNNVIASPSFGSWLQGQPLDIQKILYGENGRPNTAIFSIAHLSETERMFFVTLLLNAMIGWMRRQQGTSSLKALLYMDEIFGYFPPTGNPPSKKPMLLLLKQARAYGIGVVLATQNPVDLDYKGLSNIGTWFVGRLQTTQDQDRVLEGIVGASDGALNRSLVRDLLSDMKGRQFLLTSAHLDEPLMFETRWVMSYLKGPISLQDIDRLMADRPALVEETVEEPTTAETTSSLQSSPPILGEGVEQRYHLLNIYSEKIGFEPWLAGSASVRFYNASRNIDELTQINVRFYLDQSFDSPDWKEAEHLEIELDSCPERAPEGSSFYALPQSFSSLKNFKGWEKELSNYLYQTQRLKLLRAPSLKMESKPAETAAEFQVRISDRLREDKETAVEKLIDKFQIKKERLEKKLDSAYAKLEKEKGDVSAKTTDTILSFGTAVLGAFLGRKAVSSTTMTRTASGIRKAGRIGKEKDDVRRAEELAAQLEQNLEELENEQARTLEELAESYDPAGVETETFAIKPRRSDIFDVRVCLLWEMVPPPMSR